MEKKLSHSEENYLKEIFHLSGELHEKVSTNALAERLNAKASSITDMLKKLGEKKLVSYQKYKGCSLTQKGEQIAIYIIRKHRLWETFLVNKLNFGWDEVHDVAEQLEHIRSVKLINSIDELLNFPKYDPHGDPIPDKDGNINYMESKISLSETAVKSKVEVVSVDEDSMALLKYLDEIKISIGTILTIHNRISFDESMEVQIAGGNKMNISKKVADSIGVRFKSKI
ncbi:MAG: metal-dependent transcriptional regulator [Crocinitomicaceae bacterium]|nr:metal-dependent transcriptional regulator [Crocinitomicaceae bacterium]